MDAGELVSDEIVNAIVAERIDQADCAQGVHPRRLPAHAGAGGRASSDAVGTGLRLDAVIEFEVDDKALVGRIAKRAEGDTGRRRSRCARTTIRRSFEEAPAASTTRRPSPLIGYYYAKGMLRGVDGMAEIDAVTEQIEAVLRKSATQRK